MRIKAMLRAETAVMDLEDFRATTTAWAAKQALGKIWILSQPGVLRLGSVLAFVSDVLTV